MQSKLLFVHLVRLCDHSTHSFYSRSLENSKKISQLQSFPLILKEVCRVLWIFLGVSQVSLPCGSFLGLPGRFAWFRVCVHVREAFGLGVTVPLKMNLPKKEKKRSRFCLLIWPLLSTLNEVGTLWKITVGRCQLLPKERLSIQTT